MNGCRLVLALLVAAMARPGLAAPESAPGPAPVGSPFDAADGNCDGKISRQEFQKNRVAHFDQLDRDHNGKISRADFPGVEAHQRALAFLDAQIGAADANRDGSLSRIELAGAGTPLFDRVDASRDGSVDQKELSAYRQAIAARSTPQ